MTVPATIKVADSALQRWIDQVRAELLRFEHVPFLAGVMCEVPRLAAPAVVTINHGLRRTPRGFFVAYVERASGTTTQIALYQRRGERWDDRTIQLYSTGAFELLRVWVF